MDDQFSGRTDDALFADEFEPIVDDTPESSPETESSSTLVSSTGVPPVTVALPPTTSSHPAPYYAPGLAQSRYAGETQQRSRPQRSTVHNVAPESSNNATTTPSNPPPTSAPAPSTARPRPGSNTALANRIASGANPRTKLSETELAEKMQKMRLLSAEKARKFEQAEQDSRSHALAYEKGMEEEKRRHAELAEQRRKGEEQRRLLDQERAANRERKLKAMGVKGGAWDEGKQTEEEKDRQGFRGANGGVRGSRTLFNPGHRSPPMEFSPDDYRGRGRGRGRGGSRGGRGGRGGFAERNNANGSSNYLYREQQQAQQQQPAQAKPQNTEQAPPTAEDFPALPSSKPKTDPTPKPVPDELLPYSMAATGEKIAWDEY